MTDDRLAPDSLDELARRLRAALKTRRQRGRRSRALRMVRAAEGLALAVRALSDTLTGKFEDDLCALFVGAPYPDSSFTNDPHATLYFVAGQDP